MLPAAFSKLFEGEPNPMVQRICKDMKLFDVSGLQAPSANLISPHLLLQAVFRMGVAPYLGKETAKSPFDGEDMVAPKVDSFLSSMDADSRP